MSLLFGSTEIQALFRFGTATSSSSLNSLYSQRHPSSRHPPDLRASGLDSGADGSTHD